MDIFNGQTLHCHYPRKPRALTVAGVSDDALPRLATQNAGLDTLRQVRIIIKCLLSNVLLRQFIWVF